MPSFPDHKGVQGKSNEAEERKRSQEREHEGLPTSQPPPKKPELKKDRRQAQNKEKKDDPVCKDRCDRDLAKAH
jgi:hypothetical protein